MKIPLTGKYGKGKTMLIDKADCHWLHQLHVTAHGYAKVWHKGKFRFLHRLIAQTPHGKCTDHINHNQLDNRRCNLRIATTSQNNGWRKPQRRYFGVIRMKDKSYRATLCINGTTKTIGHFKRKRHAAMVRDIWAKDLRGEFAALNFPNAIHGGKLPVFQENK